MWSPLFQASPFDALPLSQSPQFLALCLFLLLRFHPTGTVAAPYNDDQLRLTVSVFLHFFLRQFLDEWKVVSMAIGISRRYCTNVVCSM